jgi:hypothetical protein
MSFDPQASGSEPGPSLRAQSGFNGESPSIRRESGPPPGRPARAPTDYSAGGEAIDEPRANSPSKDLRTGRKQAKPKSAGEGRPPACCASNEFDLGAFGRWSAYVPNEFGLQGPSANGRPAPTGKGFCVGGGRRLARSAWEGRFQSAQKPSAGGWSCTPNEFGLQRPSAGGRPAPTGRFLLRRRRPTPGAQRLGGPISIGAKAFGRWLVCTPNEFGLQRPSAGGRPAPTGRFLLRQRRPTPGAPAPLRADFNRRKSLRPMVGLSRPGRSFASAEADARRASAFEGRFQSAQKPSADGRHTCRMNSASRGLRPMVGLRRPGRGFASAEADAWRAAPWRGRFPIGAKAFGQWSA